MSVLAGGSEAFTLDALADDQLGRASTGYLPNAGPASNDVYAEIGNETLTHPFLAALFWYSFVRTPGYARTLGELGVVKPGGDIARIVVIHGAERDRYDLIVLSPEVREIRSAIARTDPSALMYAVSNSPALATALANAAERRRRGPGDERGLRMLAVATDEVARAGEFGLVVAPAPDLEWQALDVPDPAAPVDDNGKLLASLGVVEHRGATVVATTANHAVGNRQTVTVNGVTGRVVERSPVTDSCLLEFDTDPCSGRRPGFAGPSRTRPPRQYIAVEFDGAASHGPVAATLNAFDDSILDPQPFLATKVYTAPVTAGGDSGTALIDLATNEALGFAAYRSSANSPVTFSAWVWAEQVCDAHHL